MRFFALLLTLLSAAGLFLVGSYLPQAGIIPAEGIDLGNGLSVDWALMFGLTVGFGAVWLVLPVTRRIQFVSPLVAILWAAFCVFNGFGPSGAIGVAVAFTLFWLLGILFPYRPAAPKQV